MVSNDITCKYCDDIGKYRKTLKEVCCNRHYRQVLKYGEVSKTYKDKNDYLFNEDIGHYFTIKNIKILIDESDIYKCKTYYWYTCGNDNTSYPVAMINGKRMYLQNFILNTNKTVDHINRDIYDNRRENLRISDKSKNMMNSKTSSNNKSGVKGVWYDKTKIKWFVSISKDGIQYNLGRYDDFHKAVHIRFKKEIELFKENSMYFNKDTLKYRIDYVYEDVKYFFESV